MSNDPLFAALQDHEEQLLRFLRARTGDHALAEDLIQAAKLKVLESAGQREITDSLSYLYRMLENLVRDHRRSERSREQRNRDWDFAGEEAGLVRADPTTPERNTLDRDYLDRVLVELETLPERTRAIFLAYRVEGTSQKDIAADYEISVSAVEKHLQRAYRLVANIREKLSAGRDQ